MNDEFTQRLKKIEHTLDTFFAVPGTQNTKASREEDGNPLALLSEPYLPLLSGGGKRWRPLLMVLCYELAGGRDDSVYSLVPLIEGIHTASLIHDDIEDNSVLRRGKPAAHIVYGLDSALNAGSGLYFKALQSLETCDAPADIKLDLYAAAVHHIHALHEGQALDIHWHRNPGCFPSQGSYRQMIRLKTGALAVLAAYTGMRLAGKTKAEAEQVSAFFSGAGIGFQIADDVKNITVGNAGKKRGDDITEGKKSLPVIIHIEKHPEDAAALTAYFEQARKEGIDSPAVEQVIQMLHRSGSVTEAAEQGIAAVKRLFEQLTAYFGKPAHEVFSRLFEVMQTW
ncbi:MAG: polyprenyl synthetase family protein [Treponema sp.]